MKIRSDLKWTLITWALITGTLIMASFIGVSFLDKTSSAEDGNLAVTESRGTTDQTIESSIEGIEFETEVDYSGFGVVLLGTGGPKPSEERSSPSALVYYNSNYFLVDMGGGTQDQLLKIDMNAGDIETLMFTHHHLDHNEEYSGVLITGWLKGRNRLNLIGPSGTESLHEFTTEFYEEDMAYRAGKKDRWSWNGIKTNVEITELSGEDQLIIDGVEISTVDVIHTIDTQAYRFDVDEQSIVITGDLKYSTSLIELAKDADVMVIDSGSIIKIGSKGNGSRAGGENSAHASLQDVAEMANLANVKKLVLTHIVGEIDEAAETTEMRKYYSGEIIIGSDLMSIEP